MGVRVSFTFYMAYQILLETSKCPGPGNQNKVRKKTKREKEKSCFLSFELLELVVLPHCRCLCQVSGVRILSTFQGVWCHQKIPGDRPRTLFFCR
jgi:hypothetical protein